MRGRLLLILAICICLVGCDGITRGEVYDLEYVEPRTWVQMAPIYNGKSFNYMPIVHNEPERYFVYIRDGEQSAKLEVSRDTFDGLEVGDIFNYQEE